MNINRVEGKVLKILFTEVTYRPFVYIVATKITRQHSVDMYLF